MFEFGSHHHVLLHTAGKRPLLEGDLLRIAQHALQTMEHRFPGLKVAGKSFSPDTVSLLLDFSRLDEDVPRVIQSYKTEVKKLAKLEDFTEEHFWQREYVENVVVDQAEMTALKKQWNF